MQPKRRYGTSQNLPGVQEMRAYRNSNQDVLIGMGIGAFVGNFAAGTIAAQTYVGIPWWFGTPTLPASAFGIPVYSIVPVLVTAIKHSAAPGAMTSIYAAAGVFASCVIPMGIIGLRKASRSRDKILQSDIHGSAHWAERHEIEEAGLLQKKKHEGPIARIKRLLRLKARQAGDVYDEKHTCYVGGWTDPKTGKLIYLAHTGPEHLLAHAPTRSGKGVGLVIPTLLAWRGSVLVHDIKGENFALTAGWRESIGQRVLRFSPTEPHKSCHFNPLDEIRKGSDREVSDVQNIATMIVDPLGLGLNDHWSKTSYALLVATILHVLYCREIKEKTLAAVGSLLSRPATEDDDDGDEDKKKEGPNLSGVDEVFRQMIEYDHNPPENLRLVTPDGTKTKTHKVIAESAQEMLNKAANEKSGVLSTAMSFLSLYRDPLVAETISKSDFSIHDLMNAETPLSLYLVVPPSDKDRLKPLIRLIINQVVRRLTEKMEFDKGRSVAKYNHRLLLMIDEFPSLGKLDIFEEALAFIAGYGLKAYLICQDTAQLIKSYTANESITSNCHVRIYYAPNKIETAKHISEQLGKQTITTESHSVSYSGGGMMNFQTGSSGGIQYTGRELLTPDEVMRLAGPRKNQNGDITKPGVMITASAGHAPILGTQILYFLDPVFQRRASILPSGMRQEDVEAALAQTENDISKIPPAPTIIVPAGPGWTAPDNAIVVPVGVPIDSVTVDRGMTVEPVEVADDGLPDIDDGLPDIETTRPEISHDSDDFPDFGADDEPEQIDGPEEDTADILRDAHRIAAEKLAGAELDRALRDEEGEQILIRSTAAADRNRDKAQFTGFFS